MFIAYVFSGLFPINKVKAKPAYSHWVSETMPSSVHAKKALLDLNSMTLAVMNAHGDLPFT